VGRFQIPGLLINKEDIMKLIDIESAKKAFEAYSKCLELDEYDLFVRRRAAILEKFLLGGKNETINFPDKVLGNKNGNSIFALLIKTELIVLKIQNKQKIQSYDIYDVLKKLKRVSPADIYYEHAIAPLLNMNNIKFDRHPEFNFINIFTFLRELYLYIKKEADLRNISMREYRNFARYCRLCCTTR
jgi:hypothetical protein